MISPEEKKAWDVFLLNRIGSPSRWKWVTSRPHERKDPPVISHEFRNIDTGDHMVIEHAEHGDRKKFRPFHERASHQS